MRHSAVHTLVIGLACLPALGLAACGDGWQTKDFHGVPYTEDRTAGHGVEYVRASMMPEKSVNTESEMKKTVPAAEPVKAPEAAPAPVAAPAATGDQVFKKRQSK